MMFLHLFVGVFGKKPKNEAGPWDLENGIKRGSAKNILEELLTLLPSS